MKIPCEIDTQKIIKKGMKITLIIDKDDYIPVLQNIHKFVEKPLIVDMQINADEQVKLMNQINADQRKKIYAIIKDIANSTGSNKDYTKEELKKQFCEDNKHEIFSLSNCSNELASDFIAFLIEFAFEYGVELKEHPKEALNDIARYIAICNKRNICAICGRAGEVRRIGKSKIALCDKHKSEADKSWKKFLQKYHLVGE